MRVVMKLGGLGRLGQEMGMRWDRWKVRGMRTGWV